MQILFDGATHGVGAALAGTFVSLVLYGISVLQTFIYFARYYHTDKIYFKLLVTIVFLLDTGHKFLLCFSTWNWFTQNHGNDSSLYDMDEITFVLAIVTVAISTIVQLFFMYRILFLSSGCFRYIFAFTVMPLIIALPIATTYYVVTAWKIIDTQILANSLVLEIIASGVNVGTAVVDVIITLAMCTLVGQGRTRINANTDRVFLRLIIVSINTGFWTAVVSIVTAVLIIVLKDNFTYAGVWYPLGSLYCNTLLANLNVRSFVQSIDHHEVYNIPTIHIASLSHPIAINTKAQEDAFDDVGAKPDADDT